MYEKTLRFPFDGFQLEGQLTLPVKAKSIIIFSTGRFNGHYYPDTEQLAKQLQDAGFGTLQFNMLTLEEYENEKIYFDTDLHTHRLVSISTWLKGHSEYRNLDLAYFAEGIGAAAAVMAAEMLGSLIQALVLTPGRTDLVLFELDDLQLPILFIAGELDFDGVNRQREAFERAKQPKRLAIIPAASHLFEEPGKLKKVTNLSIQWFEKYLQEGKKSVQHEET